MKGFTKVNMIDKAMIYIDLTICLLFLQMFGKKNKIVWYDRKVEEATNPALCSFILEKQQYQYKSLY